VNEHLVRVAQATALILIGLLLGWVFFSASSVQTEISPSPFPEPIYAVPLVHENADVEIEGARYRNNRYGIEVTFPEGWDVTSLSSDDGLAEAVSPDGEVYARLNGGVFEDLVEPSHENDMRALWRLVKNMHTAYAGWSEGILYSEVTPMEPVASTTATYIRFVTYGYTQEGDIEPKYDSIALFGSTDTYFTVSFSTHGYDKTDAQYADEFEYVLGSVRLDTSSGD
jgi:hypothetical protein